MAVEKQRHLKIYPGRRINLCAVSIEFHFLFAVM